MHVWVHICIYIYTHVSHMCMTYMYICIYIIHTHSACMFTKILCREGPWVRSLTSHKRAQETMNHTPASSIDMYKNDVSQVFMKSLWCNKPPGRAPPLTDIVFIHIYTTPARAPGVKMSEWLGMGSKCLNGLEWGQNVWMAWNTESKCLNGLEYRVKMSEWLGMGSKCLNGLEYRVKMSEWLGIQGQNVWMAWNTDLPKINTHI